MANAKTAGDSSPRETFRCPDCVRARRARACVCVYMQRVHGRARRIFNATSSLRGPATGKIGLV